MSNSSTLLPPVMNVKQLYPPSPAYYQCPTATLSFPLNKNQCQTALPSFPLIINVKQLIILPPDNKCQTAHDIN